MAKKDKLELIDAKAVGSNPIDDKPKKSLRRPWLIGFYMGGVLGLFEVLPMIIEGGVPPIQMVAFFILRVAICFVIGSAPLWSYGVLQGMFLSIILGAPLALMVNARYDYFILFALVGGGITGYIVKRFRDGGEIDNPGGHR